MGKKSSKVDSFSVFVFAHDRFIVLILRFVSLSHFGWIFHAKLAHSSSSSSFK